MSAWVTRTAVLLVTVVAVRGDDTGCDLSTEVPWPSYDGGFTCQPFDAVSRACRWGVTANVGTCSTDPLVVHADRKVSEGTAWDPLPRAAPAACAEAPCDVP